MSKQTHNEQTLQRYLLGALPDAEAERLDELSVSDDEFAEALKIAESDLIDAYVQDELTGTSLEQFRSHYLASPLRREKVRFAQAFQVFALKDAAQVAGAQAGLPDKPARVRKQAGWFAAVSAFFGPRPAMQWATGLAALALLIAGSWLVFDNVRLRQEMSQVQARRELLAQREQQLQKELETQRANSAQTEQELARVRQEQERLEAELQIQNAGPRTSPTSQPVIASFTLLPPLRSAGKLPEASLPAKTGYVAMRLELEPNAFAAYRVALFDQGSNQTLWRSSNLTARTRGEAKSVAVSFPAGLLKSRAVYVLRVSGISAKGASEIIGEYPFRVVGQ